MLRVEDQPLIMSVGSSMIVFHDEHGIVQAKKVMRNRHLVKLRWPHASAEPVGHGRTRSGAEVLLELGQILCMSLSQCNAD